MTIYNDLHMRDWISFLGKKLKLILVIAAYAWLNCNYTLKQTSFSFFFPFWKKKRGWIVDSTCSDPLKQASSYFAYVVFGLVSRLQSHLRLEKAEIRHYLISEFDIYNDMYKHIPKKKKRYWMDGSSSTIYLIITFF